MSAPADAPADAVAAAYTAQLQSYAGKEIGVVAVAPDDVNVPMVRHWCQAMGDTNPVYLDETAAAASVHGGLVAPPTMLQAWVMRPFGEGRDESDTNPYAQLTALVESKGFTSVVATNCEQTYDRYLRPGDRLTMRTVIDSVSEEKTTGLGTGHFITTRQDYYDASGERVGSMLFRILKFRPAAKKPAPAPRPLRPRPSLTHDQLFWFEGLQQGKLLIQRCTQCATLRHPSGPMCRHCRSLLWDTLQASGRGTIHSFVVVHYPQIPSLEYPNQVLLVDLEEGVRVVANSIDTTPEQLQIGAPVELVVQRCDDELSLPFFKVVNS
ncbi:unannotated protein [freshwater metagenome]|uniref:Unannotated protein n=1 Tax=freshwater metagenome TaxID=449393 RepID=A0A6J7D0W4_9ZZZZ|nr:hypothetical protein [Actinomycetota bacterium]